MIEVDKDNNVVEVDTLSDLLELVAQQGIQVKISDTSELRDLELKECDYDNDWIYTRGGVRWNIKYIQNGQAILR